MLPEKIIVWESFVMPGRSVIIIFRETIIDIDFMRIFI